MKNSSAYKILYIYEKNKCLNLYLYELNIITLLKYKTEIIGKWHRSMQMSHLAGHVKL